MPCQGSLAANTINVEDMISGAQKIPSRRISPPSYLWYKEVADIVLTMFKERHCGPTSSKPCTISLFSLSAVTGMCSLTLGTSLAVIECKFAWLLHIDMILWHDSGTKCLTTLLPADGLSWPNSRSFGHASFGRPDCRSSSSFHGSLQISQRKPRTTQRPLIPWSRRRLAGPKEGGKVRGIVLARLGARVRRCARVRRGA